MNTKDKTKQTPPDSENVKDICRIYRVTEGNSESLQMDFNKNEDITELFFLLLNGSPQLKEAIFDAVAAYLGYISEEECQKEIAIMQSAQAFIRNKNNNHKNSVIWKTLN